MKKATTIMWNHLDYPSQMRALDLISELIEQQMDPLMRTALAAALMELEIWSNTPCENLPLTLEDLPDEEDDEDIDEDGNPITKEWIH